MVQMIQKKQMDRNHILFSFTLEVTHSFPDDSTSRDVIDMKITNSSAIEISTPDNNMAEMQLTFCQIKFLSNIAPAFEVNDTHFLLAASFGSSENQRCQNLLQVFAIRNTVEAKFLGHISLECLLSPLCGIALTNTLNPTKLIISAVDQDSDSRTYLGCFGVDWSKGGAQYNSAPTTCNDMITDIDKPIDGVFYMCASPGGHQLVALQRDRNMRYSVLFCRGSMVSTFAGVEYPLGYEKLNDLKMYMEKEDEFDKKVLTSDDVDDVPKKKTKGARAVGRKSKWYFEEVDESDEDSDLKFTDDKNAVIDKAYFFQNKKRKLCDKEEGVDRYTTPSMSVVSMNSFLVRPDDFIMESDPEVTSYKSRLVSVGPTRVSCMRIKNGSLIQDPTKKVLSVSNKKYNNKLWMGDVRRINKIGPPPIGESLMCDSYVSRMGKLDNEYSPIQERTEVVALGEEFQLGTNQYDINIMNMQRNILLDREKQSEIISRMDACLSNDVLVRDYISALKVCVSAFCILLQLIFFLTAPRRKRSSYGQGEERKTGNIIRDIYSCTMLIHKCHHIVGGEERRKSCKCIKACSTESGSRECQIDNR